MKELEEFFDPKIISDLWNGFESRPEQIAMAKAVEKSFYEEKHLFVEAGTGVGKSLAYLIPASIYSINTNQTVVISTETIALQNQLISKDLPMVKKLLGKDFRYEIALGASNYVCKRKLSHVIDSGTFGVEMMSHLKDFYEWEKETESGIRSEYRGFATEEFWGKITREPDNCLAKRCPNFSHSYYFLEKEKWKNANILIVNHFLLASHIAGDFKLLPPFSSLILDEAHNFPEILGRAFGAKITYEDTERLLSFIWGGEKKPGLVSKLSASPDDSRKNLINLIKNATKNHILYFERLSLEVNFQFSQTFRIREPMELDGGRLEENLATIKEELEEIKMDYNSESENLSEKELFLEMEMCQKRLEATVTALNIFREQEDNKMVSWVSAPEKNKEEKYPSINLEPLDPDRIIKENILPKMQNIIFTSATLSSGANDFSYFKKKTGEIGANEKLLASPFDYEKNCLIYIPKKLHEPVKETDELYHEDIIKLIPMLLDLTEGNAFALFTSFRSLRTVYDAIKLDCKYPIFSQSEMGSEKAKEAYLKTENSVLFGVSTFWQGIDIKGDKLKNVIIAKLPFQPPNEPVLEARLEAIRQKNGNPFGEVQLPQAILTLKQGVGRLIRSKTDKGIISILDPRIRTKNYGRTILAALPPAKIVNSFQELKEEAGRLFGIE